MRRPLLLDLFCGAGGAAVGYHRAGFDVVGVDIKEQPHYPFEFIQIDAFEFLSAIGSHVQVYDAIHASPPCQAYSAGARMRLGYAKDHPRLIEPVRDLIRATGLPYVIENVPEAPLLSPMRLCGSAFGLEVRRHRAFESNVLMLADRCHHPWQPLVVGVYGDHPEDSVIRKGHPAIRARSIEHAGEVMGIDWMKTWAEIKEAIPPRLHRVHRPTTHRAVGACRMSFDFALAEDLRRARGGIDSLAWMLNNAHQVGTDRWERLTLSARKDAELGREALDRIEARFRDGTAP